MATTILRTPDERFANLPGFDYAPNYTDYNGARIHFLKAGSGDPILCLHGEPSWSYLYRKMIPELSKAGTVYVPDFIGFGRSDKYAKISDYSFELHYNMLDAFIEEQNLRNITLIVQDWGGLIGLSYAADHPEKFARLVIMNTGLPSGMQPGKYMRQFFRAIPFLIWQNYARYVKHFRISKVVASGCAQWMPDDVKAAYDAPFPEESYKAGARAFPLLVPTFSNKHPSAIYTARAKEKLKSWNKPVLLAFSDKDPITRGQYKLFEKLIPTAAPEKSVTIMDAGHFLQEDKGEEIASLIASWMRG